MKFSIKIGTLLILGIWSLVLIPSVFASGGTLSLSPASGTFNKGCTFTLTVNADTGGAQTDATDAILFYDSTRFEATKINNGTIYSDYSGSNIDAQNGQIMISGLSLSSIFSSAGALATINFKVKDDSPTGATQIKFDFDPNDKAKTTDSNIVEHGTVADVLNQVQDGSYTIGSGTGCTTTTTTTIATGGLEGSTESGTIVTTKAPISLDEAVGGKGGSTEMTIILTVSGVILTILGIIGLALL